MARCIPKSNPESVDSPRASDLELVLGVETALRGGEVTIRPCSKSYVRSNGRKAKAFRGRAAESSLFFFCSSVANTA